MDNKRVSHGAVVLNNCIYVVGGWDGQGVVRSVEMFNPSTESWSVVSHYEVKLSTKMSFIVMNFISGNSNEKWGCCSGWKNLHGWWMSSNS